MRPLLALLPPLSAPVGPVPEAGGAEGLLHQAVQGLRLAVEAVGASIITLGVAMAAFYFSSTLVKAMPFRARL